MTNKGFKLRDLTSADYNLLMNAIEKKTKPQLPFNTEVGEVFEIANMEFIRFPATEHGVPILLKTLLPCMEFGDSNNFGESGILRELVSEILPKIEAAVGAENVLEFETDLTAIDGLKDYGSIKSKISLPTLDFYRKNIEMFDKYKSEYGFWLVTPWSTPTRGYRNLMCRATSDNIIDHSRSYYERYVRPMLYLNPSVFASE
jgi:hypothetical protein